MKNHYKHVTLGGTFDHLHAGHKQILDFAFSISDFVSIGLTSDKFIRNKYINTALLPYVTRQQELLTYLKGKGYSNRFKIIELDDIYGTTLTDSTLQAMIVTRETYANAVKINEVRISKQQEPLAIEVCEFKKDIKHKIIRSSRIRAGEITREGEYNGQLLHLNRILSMPDSLARQLREPKGIIIPGDQNDFQKAARDAVRYIQQHKPTMVIAVGDIVSISLMQAGLTPDIQIIDYQSQRKDVSHLHTTTDADQSYRNSPGKIHKTSALALKRAITRFMKGKQSESLIINGEEDLLAMPAILYAPLGSYVLYGQFNQGIVILVVTEEYKQEISRLLSQFKIEF
jgi:cytidyltransferase-like protein